jgi:hypothetical protein
MGDYSHTPGTQRDGRLPALKFAVTCEFRRTVSVFSFGDQLAAIATFCARVSALSIWL